MSQGLNPSERKRFLSSAVCPDQASVSHPASYSIGTRLTCTDHSHPWRAKAKNELSYTSTLPMSSWDGQGQLQQLQWFQNVPDVHQCRIWTRMTGSCMWRTFVALLVKWPPYWKMCNRILAQYYNGDTSHEDDENTLQCLFLSNSTGHLSSQVHGVFLLR